MGIRLGCIADDFTGATDLANNLVRAGMRVVQLIDVPPAGADVTVDADAVVIALKSRTVPAADAVEASLRALAWLRPRVPSRSTSSTAPPSTRRRPATSVRSPRP